MKNYNKPPLSHTEQLNHIKSQYGIIIDDEEKAIFYLKHHNYYRLRGYWLYFEINSKKATFSEVINLYEFDTLLKEILLKYVTKIEISVKSVFSYYLTTTYNPHIHLNSSIFKNKKYYNEAIELLKKSFNESDELFSIHYKNNYTEELPPLWVCVEYMTFGELSKWIKNLNYKDTKKIAKEYEIKSPKIFASFLYHLTEVRNKSAHHSRVWNKIFSHKFIIPKQYKRFFNEKEFKLSHTLLIIELFSKSINFESVTEEILSLAKKYNIQLEDMGLTKEIINLLKDINETKA